jgi:hypothetical protein
MPDGAVVPHGRDAVWYASGRLKHDRFFLEGEPAGLWRSWYEDGTPRSAVHCGAEPATTRWWHPNGRLSSRGPTVRAVKEGAWTFWHADGRLAEQGEYRGGRREGVWTFWNADGRMTARGVYRDDLRVGDWEVWDEDGTPGLRVPPPPPGER